MDGDFAEKLMRNCDQVVDDGIVEEVCQYMREHDRRLVPTTFDLRCLTKIVQNHRDGLDDAVLRVAVDYCLEGCRRIEKGITPLEDRSLTSRAMESMLSRFYNHASTFCYTLGLRNRDETEYERSIELNGKALETCISEKGRPSYLGQRALGMFALGKLREDKDLILSALKIFESIKDVHPDAEGVKLFKLFFAEAASWLCHKGHDAVNMARTALDTYNELQGQYDDLKDGCVRSVAIAHCHFMLSFDNESDQLFHLREAYKHVSVALKDTTTKDYFKISPVCEAIALEFAKYCSPEEKAECLRFIAGSKARSSLAGISGEIDYKGRYTGFSFAADLFYEASQSEPSSEQQVSDLMDAMKYGLMCTDDCRESDPLHWAITMSNVGKFAEGLFRITHDPEHRAQALQAYGSCLNYFEQNPNPEYVRTMRFMDTKIGLLSADGKKSSRKNLALRKQGKDLRHEQFEGPKKKYKRTKPRFRDTEIHR